MITFSQLVGVNKDWNPTKQLFLLFEDGSASDFMVLKVAVSLYGARNVKWFRDDVVMFE